MRGVAAAGWEAGRCEAGSVDGEASPARCPPSMWLLSWERRTKVCKGTLQEGKGEEHSLGTGKRVAHLSGLIINIMLWLCAVLYNHLGSNRNVLVLRPPRSMLHECSDQAQRQGGYSSPAHPMMGMGSSSC